MHKYAIWDALIELKVKVINKKLLVRYISFFLLLLNSILESSDSLVPNCSLKSPQTAVSTQFTLIKQLILNWNRILNNFIILSINEILLTNESFCKSKMKY